MERSTGLWTRFNAVSFTKSTSTNSKDIFNPNFQFGDANPGRVRRQVNQHQIFFDHRQLQRNEEVDRLTRRVVSQRRFRARGKHILSLSSIFTGRDSSRKHLDQRQLSHPPIQAPVPMMLEDLLLPVEEEARTVDLLPQLLLPCTLEEAAVEELRLPEAEVDRMRPEVQQLQAEEEALAARAVWARLDLLVLPEPTVLLVTMAMLARPVPQA